MYYIMLSYVLHYTVYMIYVITARIIYTLVNMCGDLLYTLDL